MKKFKTFVVNTVVLCTSYLIMNIVGIFFSVYISNKIGTEALGVYHLISSIYVFAITLATSGISIAITHLVSKYLALKKYDKVKKITKQAVLLSLVIGIIAMILLIFLSDSLTTSFLHSKITSKSLVIISISLPFLAISACINGYFSAVTRVIKSASANFIEQFFKITIAVCFLKKLLPPSIENACVFLVLASLLSEVISFFYLFTLYIFDKRRYNNYTINKNNSKNKNNNKNVIENKIFSKINKNISAKKDEKESYIKDILKISFPIAITSYIRSALSTLKQVMIPIRLEKSGMSCTKALSLYGVITGMVMQLVLFPALFVNVFAGLLIPEYSRLSTLKNKNRINYITNKIFKITMIFSFCIFGIFYTFSEPLSSVIYNKVEISKYIKIISPLVLIMYIDNVVDGMLKGLNKQVAVMKCNIIDLFVSIILMYFLLPIYQIYGYIIVLFVSEILNGSISIYQLIKETKVKLNLINIILKPCICMLITSYFSYLITISCLNDTLLLIYNILLYIACFIFMLFVTSTLTIKDFKH